MRSSRCARSEFTLLRFDPNVDVGGLAAAAPHGGVPMAVADVDSDDTAALYRHKLVLSRLDQHVAWRGDKPPEDTMALIDRVRGARAGAWRWRSRLAPTAARPVSTS
jgi:hypothetical protein